jgi:hypothetical protein
VSFLFVLCLQGITIYTPDVLTSSEKSEMKFRHTFLGALTKQFPTTVLASALKAHLLSSFTHNDILDTSNPPPFVGILRVLQRIGLGPMMERELSVVITIKIKEFIFIEARGDWNRRYTTVLSDWIDSGLAGLLKYILGRKDGESVGGDILKSIALRALMDLRCKLLFSEIKN